MVRAGLVSCLILMGAPAAWADAPRAVVELFTSLGCSSCPPADAFAGRLRSDAAVLVLSFHVDYWDDQKWKDPFSSTDATSRQHAYARAQHTASVFTPQIIVNGVRSFVGSSEAQVLSAIGQAESSVLPIHAEITRQPDDSLKLMLTGPELSGDVWAIRYVRSAVTAIRAGENSGRTLQTFNNVTRIERLGSYKSGTWLLRALAHPDDGIAVIVQPKGLGRTAAAVSYEAPADPGKS